MPSFLTLYLISIPLFIVLDLLWLRVVAKSFYTERLGSLLEFSLLPIILFYAVYLLGLTLFVTHPVFTMGAGWQQAALYGALFGFFTYATYDLTNWATLKHWPASIVLVDVIWGAVIAGTVAGLTYWLATLTSAT